MKTIKILTILFALLASAGSNAQLLKKLGKRAERAAERAVERRVERETEKSTDRALDSIIDAPKKGKKKRKKKNRDKDNDDSQDVIGGSNSEGTTQSPQYEVNSNFDFRPGNVAVFEDNFSRDQPGDFPAKWDANGSGEIVTVNGEKWFRLSNQATFLPMANTNLPDNYPIEFDLLTQGMDKKTSSQAMITLILDDNSNFKKGKNWSMVELSPVQYTDSQGVIEKVEGGSRVMRNKIGKDIRSYTNKAARVSIAVNKTRMRVWMDDNKIVDIPRLVAKGASNFKLHLRSLRDPRNIDEVYIANFRLAKTGADNRSKLITKGSLSTNAILFNTGSATIKSGNNPVIKEVGDAMNSVQSMRIEIIGHTDSDGNSDTNLKLSKDRAQAVKDQLVIHFGIASNRITTSGKGQEMPVADNGTKEGKAQNRRVEFKKL